MNTNFKNQLKPCPFCGNNAIITDEKLDDIDYSDMYLSYKFTIACSECNIMLNASYIVRVKYSNGDIIIERDDREQALADWNNRV